MENILFLCTGNYYRSRFAEEYLNHYAEKRRLPLSAWSRGLARDLDALRNPGPISEHTVKKLSELEIPPLRSADYPLSANEYDLHQADRSIVLCEREHRPMMRDRFPLFEEKVEYWDVEDVQVEEPAEALELLLEELNVLIREYE